MRKVFGWMLAPLLVVSFGAFAQTPREKFAQMLDTLQKTPKDDALRESIVRLGRDLKPAPAVPEDARRELVRGNTALDEGSSADDYARAVTHYEDALALAPWWGAAYIGLARAEEQQSDYSSAERNLKLYMLTTTTADDSRKAQDYLYSLQDKLDRADKKRADYDTKFGWLAGQWSLTKRLVDQNGYTVADTDPVEIRSTEEGSRVVLRADAETGERSYNSGVAFPASIRVASSLRLSYDASGQLKMELFGADDAFTCPALQGWRTIDFELSDDRKTITAKRLHFYPPPVCQESTYSLVWFLQRAP
jgi:hypothetical protein